MLQPLPTIELLLASLVPGFVVAFVYYALVAHEKPGFGERLFFATLFSLFVKLVVLVERKALEYIGQFLRIGEWGVVSEFSWAFFSAILSGILLAKLVNAEFFHKTMRFAGVSSKIGHPTEWHWAFKTYIDFVVIHFKDGRRLSGFPEVWPSDPNKGHFFIYRPKWVHVEDAKEQPDTEGILVSVKSIQHIEFLTSSKVSENGSTS
jgi:hypothetical protein